MDRTGHEHCEVVIRSLEKDSAANAAMLARQCDLARDAEARAARVEREAPSLVKCCESWKTMALEFCAERDEARIMLALAESKLKRAEDERDAAVLAVAEKEVSDEA